MSEEKIINVMELRFEEKEGDDFAKRFNTVGKLYDIAVKEDTDEAWKAYSEAKYCLEQGLPL